MYVHSRDIKGICSEQKERVDRLSVAQLFGGSSGSLAATVPV